MRSLAAVMLMLAGVFGGAQATKPQRETLPVVASLAGTYGSGTLGPWAGSSRDISTPDIIQRVSDTNGVWMAGDSISVSTAYELATMLYASTGDLMAVNNWSGRPSGPAVDAMVAWLGTYGGPRRLLMAVGTNDIFDPPGFGGQVDRLMTAAGPTRTVFWVSVQVARTSQPADVQLADQRNSGWINAQLYAAAARWPNLRIIPWHQWLALKPSRLPMYLRDGVHVNDLGSTFRNDIIRDAIVSEAN